MRIRSTARTLGLNIAPVAGLFVKSVKVPWYYPSSIEPSLSKIDTADFVRVIKNAASPKFGGNTGLKREIDATLRQLQNPKLPFLQFALMTMDSTRSHARRSNLILGPRLRRALDEEV